MRRTTTPALTSEQWEARDYRQSARELDDRAKARGDHGGDDATEYVAKVGLTGTGAVVVMNRAHDRVLIPAPAKAPLAAFALVDEPFGFTSTDVEAVLRAAERSEDEPEAAALRELARRLEALLPPRAG